MEPGIDARMPAHSVSATSNKRTCAAQIVYDLENEINSLHTKVKDAIAHALKTQTQAESQHLSHPSLFQRAHGATLANEPPRIHHAYWQLRSVVRDSQHKDELALGEIKVAHCELISRNSDVRRMMTPQGDAILSEGEDLERKMGFLMVEVKALEEMVNSRAHVIGDGEGE